MSEGASILHADLDAFYASVEQRDDPRLRGRPVIVGGGVVLACSYEAKRRGVRTAMGGRQARQLCPDAVVVPPRMRAYSEASRRVFEVFRDTTPVVEGISIDEAFLDVRGLWRIAGTPRRIAEQLRADVLREVGLPITVGVARTKFLAKVAGGLRAAERGGRTVVLRLRFADFTKVTRSHTLAKETWHTTTILDAVHRLHRQSGELIATRGLTLIGIAVANLDGDGAVQLELPLHAHTGGELDSAMDQVRDRFGSSALTRASLLGRQQGPTTPLLPD